MFRNDLRRAVIFGRHDLVQDAPISRVDLLVCRNVLMYFNASTQARILQSFQFALAPDGYLFLGKSEVLLSRTSAFMPVDLRSRVFRKLPADVATAGTVVDVPARVVPAALDGDLLPLTFEQEPLAHLVVDPQARLVHANERARALFGLVTGDIGRPLQDMELSYRPVELRSRIQESSTEARVVTVREVEWVGEDGSRWFDVLVIPLTRPSGERAGTSIVFTDVSRPRSLHEELQRSKRELQTAYEELQSTVEELETTNEELQSTNEELETTNEELQSTNEELETMNEELQSTNEELRDDQRRVPRAHAAAQPPELVPRTHPHQPAGGRRGARSRAAGRRLERPRRRPLGPAPGRGARRALPRPGHRAAGRAAEDPAAGVPRRCGPTCRRCASPRATGAAARSPAS